MREEGMLEVWGSNRRFKITGEWIDRGKQRGCWTTLRTRLIPVIILNYDESMWPCTVLYHIEWLRYRQRTSRKMSLISFGVWGNNFRREKQGRWMWSQWQITECEAMEWGWDGRMDSEKEDRAMDQKSLCGWSELGAPPRELKDNFCARKYEKALRRLETQTKYWVNMAIKSFSWMPSKALRRNKQTKETKPKSNDFI